MSQHWDPQHQPDYGNPPDNGDRGKDPYPPAGYAQPVHPQPGYPPPGYAPPGYPAAPGYAPQVQRPGSLTASAVLTLVQSGLVVLGSVVAMAGGSVVVGSDLDPLVGNIGTWLTVLAIGGLIAAGLLIAGGVKAFAGELVLLRFGSAASLLMSVLWFVWGLEFAAEPGAALVWPLMFAVLPVIALALGHSEAGRRWAAARPTF